MNMIAKIEAPLPKTGDLLGASTDLTDLLETVTERISIGDGDVLFDQGDPGDALFAIESGGLDISVLSPEGRKLSLYRMKPGEVLGEIALFDNGSRTATATAVGSVTLRRICREDLLAAVATCPRLAIDLIEVAGRRLRSVSDKLHDHVFLPMHARLARKMLELSMTAAGPLKEVRMSHGELADFVASSREAVSRTLSLWKKDGVLDLGRGTVTIRNRQALQVLAEAELH